jgi:ubiquinone/menaquinone biosynthesis C-methylase UbiE
MNATIDSMSDSVHLYWEAQAATFDDEPDHGLLHPKIRDGWRRLLLEHLLPAPADVIDLGCGTGTLSVLLAESGYRVRGLDFAAAMISAATMKAAMASVQVTFQRGDAARPPYQPASCDVVLCRHLWRRGPS